MKRRFILVDHSLSRVGGHEFDYAVNVLQAAEAAGYTVVLAANRRFGGGCGLPDHWPVFPLFPHTAYSKHCVSMGGHRHLPLGWDGRRLPDDDEGGAPQRLGRTGAGGAWSPGDWFRRIGCRRRIDGFARACERLFERTGLCATDDVLLATVTEFDLLGLSRYLAIHPESRSACWHLQFHFNLFEGCRTDEAEQERRLAAVRRQFRHALDRVPHHRIRFYNTTVPLADQYNRLDVATFRHLPYPVSPALSCQSRSPGVPVRVTCAGGMRKEKRLEELRTVVRALREGPPPNAGIELLVQLPPGEHRRLMSQSGTAAAGAEVRVSRFSHPLPVEAYHELIHRTDIGLFLYDSGRYRMRCSSILLEMLAAGKPVIVPSGCWLAEQVAEASAAGRVGLIAARSQDVPALLRDMVQHHAQYRKAAEAFSRQCIEAHHPDRTIEILRANGAD